MIKPDCKYGYTEDQIIELLGQKWFKFDKWMKGKTVAKCPKHGMVTYPCDLASFFRYENSITKILR